MPYAFTLRTPLMVVPDDDPLGSYLRRLSRFSCRFSSCCPFPTQLLPLVYLLKSSLSLQRPFRSNVDTIEENIVRIFFLLTPTFPAHQYHAATSVPYTFRVSFVSDNLETHTSYLRLLVFVRHKK